ncbi:hypothetical protein [Komagataeibacter swingsii]|uniref:Uncharacterized protein n=1 Tax=Komagataeibacter swingsii TaxID=215220 RepID=A0A850NSI2_9PROT|nr:hypothetical protein [Komagataeibacter swingsii]NVN35405.1 hypothetical protein [Komagataeibacter swingsii]
MSCLPWWRHPQHPWQQRENGRGTVRQYITKHYGAEPFALRLKNILNIAMAARYGRICITFRHVTGILFHGTSGCHALLTVKRDNGSVVIA